MCRLVFTHYSPLTSLGKTFITKTCLYNFDPFKLHFYIVKLGLTGIQGMFEMNCLLSSSSISTWGTIKTDTYLYRVIQYLHNGV